jgi:oxygen-dependent protoporphyrinogen oxidase
LNRVLVIGGGIAGLSAAYYIRQRAAASGRAVECTLLETAGRLGGKIVTERRGDLVIEGGPDSFVTDKPWGLKLTHELGLADQLIPCNKTPRSIYILRGGKPLPMPPGFRLGIPTEAKPLLQTTLLSPWAKMRMGLEIFVPRRADASDESLASFITRRLGRECLDKLAGPLMAGIFVSDPQRMSMASTFPRFPQMEREHGSLIRAMQAAKRRKPPAPPPGAVRAAGGAMFNSLRGGMDVLTDTLAARIAESARTGVTARAVRRHGDGFIVDVDAGPALEADAVVLAVPAFVAADLVGAGLPELATSLRTIRYVHSAVVSLAYRRADLPTGMPLDSFGVIVPASEPCPVLAFTWSSLKFSHRSPDDRLLMRVFIGGYRAPEKAALPEAEMVAMVRGELDRIYGLRAEPVEQVLHRWLDGNPQFDVGHLDRVTEMEKMAAAWPGLHLIGSAYRGVGIPDCTHSGLRAAEALLP